MIVPTGHSRPPSLRGPEAEPAKFFRWGRPAMGRRRGAADGHGISSLLLFLLPQCATHKMEPI